MSLRRAAPLVMAAVVAACQPSLNTPSGGEVAPPAQVFTPVFDTTNSVIPLPNDLALQTLSPAPATASNALDEFKQLLLNTYGGFPPDQSGVTIKFSTINTADGSAGPAPALDLSTISDTTVAIVQTTDGKVLHVDPAAASYDVDPANPNVGTLTLVPIADASGSRRWPQGGRLVVALRGGPNGIKTKSGDPIAPGLTMQLLLSPVALTDPSIANSSIIQQVIALGGPTAPARLELLRQTFVAAKTWLKCPLAAACPGFPVGTWVPGPGQGATLSAFAAVDTVFPHAELASVQTFTIGTLAGTWVDIDSAAGKVPLPSDLISLPGLVYSNGTLTSTGKAFGALAPGLATLDGFGTTPMLLASTSGPVIASTITGGTTGSVLLFEQQGSSFVLLQDFASAGLAGRYLSEPPPIIQTVSGTGVSTVIGLQPAVNFAAPAPPFPTGTFAALPPLKERTTYVVVITKNVHDFPGNQGLVRGTLPQILFGFSNSLVSGSTSVLPIFTNAQAVGLETMRNAIRGAVFPILPGGVTASDVVMAYTFKTQTITGKAALTNSAEKSGALQLAAFPYSSTLPDAPVATNRLTPTQAEQKYGLPAALGFAASGQVAAVIEATIVTYDLLDPASGAFLRDTTKGAASSIPALVVIPATLPANAPLVVFRHGINQARSDVLAIATALAQGGMVAAAIDADKHGDRSWCKQNSECATGTCVADATLANQGDAPGPTPGFCKLADGSPGQLAYNPEVSSCTLGSCWNGTGGKAKASGNFFVSANLFRTRDSLRQDVIDQSVLVRALTSSNGQTALRNALSSPGSFSIDATKVYYVGQSLGAIQGTVNVAANPRFSRTVLNVGGGTLPDIFDQSPAFATQITALLAGLGITKGTPAYLQFIQVAKWALDPADPVNFAQNLVTAPLPNLLAGGTQTAKAVLGQAARCDNVVPNLTNQLLYGNVGLSPLAPATSSATPSLQWYMADSTTACPTDGTTGQGATHGFLIDFVKPAQTAKAQGDVVNFLVGLSISATPVVTP